MLLKGFTDELKSVAALAKIGAADAELLDSILERINKFVDAPLRMHASTPADALLNLAANKVKLGDGRQQSSPPADDTIASYPATTINLQTGAVVGGSVLTEGGVFTLPTTTIGEFRRMVLVYRSADNVVDTVFSDAAASVGALENPGLLFAQVDGTPVGYIDLEATAATAYKTPGSATAIIENEVSGTSYITVFGGGTGSGAGGDPSFTLRVNNDTATVKKGSMSFGGYELYLAADISFDLKTGVNSRGVTAPANSTRYYLYIDTAFLDDPAAVGDNDRLVIVPASGVDGAFVVKAETPLAVNRNRYIPLAVMKTDGSGNYTTVESYSRRNHDLPADVVSPTIETIGPRSIGTVGCKANAQGVLSSSDFTTPANARWWELNSDANDDSGNALNLTSNGTPVFTGKGFFGREGIAKFDGVDDYFSSNNSYFDITTQDFSIGGWFKLEQWVGAEQGLLTKWDPTGQRSYILYVQANGNITILTSSNGTTNSATLASSQTMRSGSWHHVAATFDLTNDLISLYVDGQLAGRVALVGNLFDSSTDFRIGAYASSGSPIAFMRGEAQDVFFCKEVLSPAQMNTIYSHRFTNHQQIAGGHILQADSFPFASLANKIAFFNLAADANDDSGNSKNLTNNGTIVFTGENIFGAAGAAVMDGVDDNFSSTDAFFNPGNKPFAMGGWFSTYAWGGNNQTFMSNEASAADDGFRLHLNAGGVDFRMTGTASAYDATIRVMVSHFAPGSWHHLAMSYDGYKMRAYIDGKQVGENTLPLGQRSVTSSIFRIGALRSAPTDFLFGKVQDCFFANNTVLMPEDIMRLFAARLDLTVAVPVQSQYWQGMFTREDGYTENELEQGWLFSKGEGQIQVDFATFDPGDKVALKLRDQGASGRTIPVKKFAKLYTSTPPATIAHGLPERPSYLAVLHDELADGKFKLLDGGFLKCDETNIYTSMGVLTIDSTHPVEIVACIGDPAIFRENVVRTVTGATTARRGEQLFANTSGGAFAITLPISPSVDDRVTVYDAANTFDTNNLTLDRNGQSIEGAAANYVLDVEGTKAELVFVGGSIGWKVYD